MNYNEIELTFNKGLENEETKIIRLRLTCEHCCSLEEKTKKGLIEYLQEENMTMVVTMLRYMRAWELPQFSTKDAQNLYDTLIENGYTYKKIVQDVIYETLVVSGFLERAEWERIKKVNEEATKRQIEEVEKFSTK